MEKNRKWAYYRVMSPLFSMIFSGFRPPHTVSGVRAHDVWGKQLLHLLLSWETWISSWWKLVRTQSLSSVPCHWQIDTVFKQWPMKTRSKKNNSAIDAQQMRSFSPLASWVLLLKTYTTGRALFFAPVLWAVEGVLMGWAFGFYFNILYFWMLFSWGFCFTWDSHVEELEKRTV